MSDTTLKGLRTELRNLAGQPEGSDFDTMADAAINRFYRLILAHVDQDEQTREVTITTASGTKDYGIPYAKRILNIDDSANRRSLEEQGRGTYNKRFPGTATTGSPRKYHILGNFGVDQQPSAAGVISVVSSATTDSSNRFIRIKGFDASNRLVDEKVTLTGTSSASTTQSFEKIETIVKSNNSGSEITGYLTVTDASANTLVVMPFWDTMMSNLWVRFYPIPEGVASLTAQVVMRKSPLVRDDDWPEFDPDFHHLLVSGPGSELLASTGKSGLANKMLRDYEVGLGDFKGTQGRRPNRSFTYGNVSNAHVTADRPLIPNVDFV